MQATGIRKGTTLLFQNDICVVTDFRHATPGNKRGFVQVTLKSLKSGKLVQNKFSSDENVERVVLDLRMCQFLYKDDSGFHFMDMENYHNFPLSENMVGNGKFYLKENAEIKINFYDDKPIMPEIPKTVILKVTESPTWVRGDSVSNNMKPAVCETGLKVQVPLFVEEGTEIKVNTDSGEYVSRA